MRPSECATSIRMVCTVIPGALVSLRFPNEERRRVATTTADPGDCLLARRGAACGTAKLGEKAESVLTVGMPRTKKAASKANALAKAMSDLYPDSPAFVGLSISGAKELRSLLACPICDKVSLDPWSLIACGHTYCRHCIEPYTNDKHLLPYCPQCVAMSMSKDPPRESHVTGPIRNWAK